MIPTLIRRFLGYSRSPGVSLGILAIWTAASGLAQQSAQPVFPSPADAGRALFQAVQRDSEEAIANILGAPSELASSDDEGQDKVDRELFVQKYQEMHRTSRDANGSVTLYIGAENWPFPIPFVEKDGAWRFDADAGQKEVLFRRIGENELTAIAMCHEFAAAEKQYRARATDGNPTDSSPVSLVAKTAIGSAMGDPVLFHGYYFRALPSSRGNLAGRFVFVVYPAEYRSSGVMTFVVTEKNTVYEKDLGANTSALAKSMMAFHKDASWRASDE
jgi:hypothetical protein